ncbi:MAG: glycoside hydrolase family 43 protein [Actinomycetota bacterium]|nr:glycoside hydrolase family 43 protein [Actinomycetota bacterium]
MSPRAARASCALALLLVLASGCGRGDGSSSPPTPSPPRGGTFANPVHDANFADPFVLRVGDTYVAYATNAEGANVQTLRSRDLVRWRAGKDALPKLGRWAVEGRTWAPEVLRRRDGRYVLYYTAQSLELSAQCIGRAVSKSPDGPFVDRSRRPFICQKAEGGSIDASPFTDDGGALYLLWKNDGNCCGVETFIYAQRLSPDGLTLLGKRARLVKQDASWEGELVEAPTLWKERGRYFLFFSANAYYNESYAVGYARCRRPLGPCKDSAENPILETACRAVGPGHQAIVRDGDGDTWIVYHAWPPDAVGSEFPGRVLWIDRLLWREGKPDVRGPTCGPQQVP